MIKTKIICTIGPAIFSAESLVSLAKAGMNVVRINFSHGTRAEHLKSIELVREARKKLDSPLAIMLDTQGPEVRVGVLRKQFVEVSPRQRLFLTDDAHATTDDALPITAPNILPAIPLGATLLINDGYISSKVVEIVPHGVIIEIENQGVISSSKGINIPNVQLPLPRLTKNDIDDIRFGCEQNIDVIALSFVRDAETVLQVKKILAEESKRYIQVIAKIENPQGVANFDEILEVADGIMVARGDLGVEVPLSVLPRLQKMMLNKCSMAGKPGIVATQMLESMIVNPRPTRAEVLDVANAIYDSSSAVMLSGETAVGKYPIETVSTMKTIIEEAEKDFHYTAFFEAHARRAHTDVPSAITLSAVKTADDLNARAIITFTKTGTTAQLISRLKPKIPILAFTPSEHTYHRLALQWGVQPILCKPYTVVETAVHEAGQYTLESGLTHLGDLLVIVVGYPLWICGTTSTILVEHVGGDILLRGGSGEGGAVHGKITFIHKTQKKKPPYLRESILVLKEFDDAYVPLLEEAAGLILQETDADSQRRAKMAAEKLSKPIILNAKDVYRVFREGQYVTLDPKRALVYKGFVEHLTPLSDAV